jgi:hypothetical protein
MPGQWQQGLAQAARRHSRAELAEWLADHGYDEEHEMRKLGSPACATGSCASCDREEPGGSGCPHGCHDATADETAARTAAWREEMRHA